MRPLIKSFKKVRPVAFLKLGKIRKIKKQAKISLEKFLKNTKSPVLLGFQMYQYPFTDLCSHLYINTHARFLKAYGSRRPYYSKCSKVINIIYLKYFSGIS